MTADSMPHRLSVIIRRLFAVVLIVIFTCGLITAVLKPAGASAQAIEVTRSLTAMTSTWRNVTGQHLDASSASSRRLVKKRGERASSRSYLSPDSASNETLVVTGTV